MVERPQNKCTKSGRKSGDWLDTVACIIDMRWTARFSGWQLRTEKRKMMQTEKGGGETTLHPSCVLLNKTGTRMRKMVSTGGGLHQILDEHGLGKARL